MKKSRLEGNILPKSKQRFNVEGFPSTEILILTRDTIEMTIGVIELPDQTKVPGGRKRAGEFTVTLQFARNVDRETYVQWFNMCVDDGQDRGINPTYKRNATIVFLRLFNGSPGNFNSGSALPPVRAKLYGCWPSSIIIPDYDMNADESDGDTTLEITINYDESEIEQQNSLF